MTRSFWSLVFAQCQVFINDNAAKLMLIVLAGQILPAEQGAAMKSFLAALVVLPFVLLSPSIGWMADRYSKRDILYYSQYLQLLALALMLGGIIGEWLWVAILAFFLLGVQCAVFSTAKQGLIKEVVGTQKLSTAVGRVEISAVISILAGGLIGGALFSGYKFLYLPTDPVEAELVASEIAWQAGIFSTAVLCYLAAIGWWLCSRIERTPTHSHEKWRSGLLYEHFGQLRDVWENRPVLLCVLGNSYFYALAGALYLTLSDVSEVISTDGGAGTAIRLGMFLALLGGGMAAGSIFVSRLTMHHFELGLIPIGSAGMILGTMALGLIPPQSYFFNLALILLGFFGSFFVVPLNAYLQECVQPAQRGRMLSANMLLTNLVSIIAIALYFILSMIGLEPWQQFLVYTIPTIVLTAIVIAFMPARLLRFSVGAIARALYRVVSSDVDRIPEEGGVLLVPNHITYVDAIMLQLACPRDIRFLVHEDIYKKPWLNWGLKILRTIPVSPKHAKTAIARAADALTRGEVVCIFPEGALTRTSHLGKLNRGYELIARKAGAPVQPVWLENLWGSIFSFFGGKYFFKWPRAVPYHVYVYFGEPVPCKEAGPARIRRDLYDLGQRAFAERPELRTHIGSHAITSLKRSFFKPVVIDAYQNGRVLKGGTLLAASLRLAEWLKKEVPEKRIAIVLPPGAGATVVNLACSLANKTAVNLNFTAGRDAVESALRRADIQTALTAQAVQDKLEDFPWPSRTLDIVPILKAFSKPSIVKWMIAGLILPTPLMRFLAGVPRLGEDREASLLFTSGSSGEPKGVVLSHRNIVANTAQIGAIFANTGLNNVLGCLPVFHSFGFTVTMWWPILGGPYAVTWPSPLDAPKLIDVIDKYDVELMINTPTFLRAYLRRAKREQLDSLKLVVTGAEKLPRDLLDKFESRFGITVCEGYGMTEATPVISTNLLDIPSSLAVPGGAIARRIGSVGRMLPGISARIRDPETDEDLSLFEPGMLWLKGANVFNGYLNDPERSDAVLKDGWYKTGDIARLDEDGFLHIEGRLSRFSKIAGEMIPHGTVEEKLAQAMGQDATKDETTFVVMGVPDESKGEALVLLTTQPVDMTELRPRLLEGGMPALWIPRHVAEVEAIPLLASGKLDLRGCQELALAQAKA